MFSKSMGSAVFTVRSRVDFRPDTGIQWGQKKDGRHKNFDPPEAKKLPTR